MPLCIPDYDFLDIHKMMLSDSIRTSSYCDAIRTLVKKDMVVIDFGSGTGILSIASVKAGAKKSFAIEKATIAKASKKIIYDNGLSSKIVVIKGDVNHLELPEKADIIVSEWMGIHVFQENMLFDLLDVKDKHLKEGGILIPNMVSLFIAPIKTETINEKEIAFWEAPLEGISLKEIGWLSMNDTYIDNISAYDLASDGKCVFILNLHEIQKNELNKIVMTEEFSFEKPQRINGICGWFTAQLSEEIVLDTGPHAAPTHWKQTIYPIYPGVDVNTGDTMIARIIAEPNNGFTHFTWSVSVKGKEPGRKFSTKNNYILPQEGK